ncbi:hypothetical protein [Nonomuraea helvata]|uniref:Membrane transporter protein n=1 Tax=Nonomuraea helvata TaxID=37484 RepID=A0ABV5S311_9ACTN
MTDLLFLLGAGLLAGVVNALAGGGILISFPALLALGYPSLTASVTNAVALWPGYLGGGRVPGHARGQGMNCCRRSLRDL